MTRTAPSIFCATLAGLTFVALPCVATPGIAQAASPRDKAPIARAEASSLGPASAGLDVKAGVDAWSAGDFQQAVRLWKPLADKGDADAQFNLAQAYKLGRGVTPDEGVAEGLYGRAAASGHIQAADSYGLLLFQRGERQRALPYIQASAARGDARAQYILGVAHFNGDIVEKDWLRAYALVSLARQAGLPQATRAMTQMDSHIPLADRQKSVLLSQRIAAETKAHHNQLSAASELGQATSANLPAIAAAPAMPHVRPDTARQPSPPRHLEAEPVEGALSKPAGTAPGTPGADYARPATSLAAGSASPTRTGTAAVTPLVAAATRPAPTPAPKPAPKPAAKVPPKPAVASGPWRVQLGAFGVAGNAEALWAKVRGRPELAGHPRSLVPAGRLTKLQATGFASSAQAQAACARLSAAGFACAVARD